MRSREFCANLALWRNDFSCSAECIFPREFISLKRSAHTDIPPPDFDDYRLESLKNPNVPSKCSSQQRKTGMYVTSLGTNTKNKIVIKRRFLPISFEIEMNFSYSIPTNGSSVNHRRRGCHGPLRL